MKSSKINIPLTFFSFLVLGALLGVVQFGNAYLISFIFTILIYYILAQSWDWIAGEMGYVNLGHYCFYGIGSYAFGIFLVAGQLSVTSMALTVLITCGVAAIIAYPLYRLKGDYFAFATLALLPLMEVLAYNMSFITNGAEGIVFPIQKVTSLTYVLALALCFASFVLTLLINRSRFGYALRAIRNDEEVSEVIGIKIFPYKVKVLVISAVFAGLAGALQGWQLSYIDPGSVFGLNVALVPIAMVLFGGSGMRWGPLVGVILLACIQHWMLVNLKMLQTTIYGLIILCIGRFMPGGLLRASWIKNNRILSFLSKEHHEYMISQLESNVVLSTATTVSLQDILGIKTPNSQLPILECLHITKSFGGNMALDDVSFRVNQGEIIGLIGANGSGKTTLFNCISRVFQPSSGQIRFLGQDLSNKTRDEIAQMGIGRTYQLPRPFGDLTVLENLAMPLMFGGKGMTPQQALITARALSDFIKLTDKEMSRSDSLSLQEKKAIEFGRALALRPSLLLVDEVASGLTPIEVNQFVEHIRTIRDQYGVTVIWVEHIFSALTQVVDRLIVLDTGRLVADGPLAEVLKDEKVIASYLGNANGDTNA
ncbi:MAG: branched-chain amino acid ABC transporter ATP-binding protein/permease [Betaproteobacteria bacterium]